MRVVKLKMVPAETRDQVRQKIAAALAKSPEAEKWLDFFEEHCYSDRITCYVVQDGEEYLPAVIMYVEEIEDCPMVWVAPEHERKGCGRSMVDHVGLRCVDPGEGGHEFWKSLGFQSNSEGRWTKCDPVQ